MTDTNPSQDGGDGSDGQRKRQLKPGRAQEAPPAKRMSIIPLMRLDRAKTNANAEVWRGNTSPATASQSRYAESENITGDDVAEACATGRSPELGLLGRGCPSSSLPMQSGGGVDFESSNPAMDGGGRTGSNQSSNMDGCGPSTTSCRRKRAREPGKEEKPAPVKRMSPTSLRRHEGLSGGPDTAIRRVDPPPLHDSSESSLSHREVLGNDTSSEGIAKEDSPMSAPGNWSCLSPSLKRESTRSENDGVGNDTVSPARGSPVTDKSSTEKHPGADCKEESGSNVDFDIGNAVIGGGGDGGLSTAFGKAPPTASKSRHAESEDVTRDDVAEACATGRSPESGLLGRGCPSSSLPMESGGGVDFESSNPAMAGGGRTGSKQSSNMDGCGPSTTSCRRKRARELGKEEKPAPVKRMSPTCLRRHDGVSSSPDTAIRRVDSPPLHDSSESSSSYQEVLGNDISSEGIVREDSPMSAPGNRSCLCPSLKRESIQSENGDVGNATVSPARGSPMADKSSTEKHPGADFKEESGSNDGGVAITPSIGSDEELGLGSGKEPPPATTISPIPLRGRGSATGALQADASLTADYTSDLFELEGLTYETTPAMACNTFPVDGSTMAAMGTPPRSFSSPLQQLLLDFSCEVSVNGGGGDCALPLPLSLPPPEASDEELSRTPHESLQGLVGGLEAPSRWDGGCASISRPGSGGGFSAPPAACLSPMCSARGTTADSIASGRGEVAADEVDGFGLLIPDVDITECMATLQATPTDFGSQNFSVPPSSPPRDLCNDTGGCVNDDNGVHVGEEQELQSGGCDRRGVTTRIGDLFQAAIPDLANREGIVDSPLARAPSLQLWRPGIVPERALDLVFPRPRREGAGSSEIELKMMSAFLIARASGFERERCDGGGNGDAPLKTLAEVAANGDGSSWRSDWPEEDKEAFGEGVYAFRRDFGRIRRFFLPHREVPELVDFFYRRWKRNPEYSAWKNTDQLIGRRVAQRVGSNETRQGAGLGKSFDDHGMRRGWVVRKEVRGRKETFVVHFQADGSSQAMFEKVSIGVLETMLVEGSATDEERASEAFDSARVAQNRSEIATLSARACISPGHGAFSPATGTGGVNAPSRPTSRVASGSSSTID